MKFLISIVIVCIILIFVTPVMSKSDLSFQEIQTIARGTTVLIGANLEPNQVEQAQEDLSAGSGVIVHRNCNTNPAMSGMPIPNATMTICEYYVLTNAHVIADPETDYGIRTADGRVYGEEIQPTMSDQNSPYQYHRQIYRYEKQGYDLALLSFVSDIQYPVAAFGNPNQLQPKDIVYVSGWAVPPKDKPKRIRQTITGEIRQKYALGEIPMNYTLGYTLGTKVGISGGPVFNNQGELIGIHGKGAGENLEDIGKDLTYAIDIQKFINLVASSDIGKQDNFSLHLPQPLDPLAMTFGRKYLESGDNMTAEERKKFVIADMLRDDPRRDSVEYLAETLGCLEYYEGGAIGAGLSSVRSQFTVDLNTCMNAFEQLIQENVAVQREKLDSLKQQIENLE
ncbi:putative serine protease [Crocosphaera chwakensis CCY0110]|uniref:Putative serine protease n=2 Tax=Crocosphaera TaxID=263510 RepID=A3ILJ4_9CHRO|nr:putative serine protease [Crocosphaera chwakensis CCY0110]